MIGQITADRLVYAFLTSLITAEGGGAGRREGGSEKENPCSSGSRRTYGSSNTLKGGVVYTGITPAGVIFLRRHFTRPKWECKHVDVSLGQLATAVVGVCL